MNPAPFNPHRSTQLFPLMITDLIESHVHTCCGIFRKATKSSNTTGKIIKLLQSCYGLFVAGRMLLSDAFPNFSFLLQRVFRRAVVSVQGQELCTPNVCVSSVFSIRVCVFS